MTYKVQIDDLVRDATPEEVAALDLSRAEAALAEQAAAEAAAAKASAKAKLAALGLTDAEITALLGV
jgi:hypothetical protein